MRVVRALLLLVAGAATALATVALHSLWWGLLLGAAATLAALVAVGPGPLTRLSYAVGWTGLLGYLLLPRGTGGFVVAADPAGYALMGLGLVVLVFAGATLPRPRTAAGEADRPT